METAAAAPPVIDIRSLTKTFLTDELETHALSNVDLSIRDGDYVAIVGPSGSGKTTLLAILGLLDRPTAGDYRIGGYAVGDLGDTELAQLRNEHIGFIFQQFNLIGDISVSANVELPLMYRGMSRDERRDRVHRALERVGMTHRARHTPDQLSGGQQQRVAIARALVGEPRILLADEPTGNLDSTNGEMVMDLISELHAAGSTICLVTHDPRFSLRASRRIRMSDGVIVEELS